MNLFLPLAIFSSINVATAIFFAIYLLKIYKGERLPRLFLAGLILSIATRIGKSIIYYVFGIPDFGTAIGFLGLANIGVFTWLYAKYITSQHEKFKRVEYLHFVIGFIGFLLIWPFSFLAAQSWYLMGSLISLSYLACSFFYLWKNKTPNVSLRKWNTLLLASVFTILLFFILQLNTKTLFEYALGAGVASVLMYVLFFAILKNDKLLLRQKSKSIVIEKKLMVKIQEVLEEQKLYKSSSLTLNQLSEQLGEPSYKISIALKKKYNKKFPELINSLRISDVKNQLTDGKSASMKIESIAFDVGFNSLSSFNAAFKKFEGVTPSIYKKNNTL